MIQSSMTVLALDTTTRKTSCAVSAGPRVIAEHVGDHDGPVAERVPAELVTVLADARLVLRDVDVFAVTTGPGSFTGLRIGIAAMQGLAFAMGKPLVGISGLDALAQIGRSEAPAWRVATWVDAWRGEVYASLYVDGRETSAPCVARPDALLPELSGSPTLFIGDGALAFRDIITAALGPDARLASDPVPALARQVALLASAAAAGGVMPAPHEIRPLYVRRTDAELARDARLAR
jgi:tRNA threonylcarbamoyladenosine biosynthesis protein TsaB